MEQKELYDSLVSLEQQAKQYVEQLGIIKEELSRMNQENHKLRMENQYLRDRLDDKLGQESAEDAVESEENPSGLTKSRLNLENIYEDGFHVCNLFFGKRREEDSPCAFCLEVIYGDRNQELT